MRSTALISHFFDPLLSGSDLGYGLTNPPEQNDQAKSGAWREHDGGHGSLLLHHKVEGRARMLRRERFCRNRVLRCPLTHAARRADERAARAEDEQIGPRLKDPNHFERARGELRHLVD